MRAPRHRSISIAVLVVGLGLGLAACGGADTVGSAPADSVRTGTSLRLTTTVGPGAGPSSADPSDTTSGTDTSEVDGSTPADGGDGDADGDQAVAGAQDPGGTPPPLDQDWSSTVYRLTEVASLDFPMAMAARPGSDDLWVNERDGRVRRIEPQSGLAADRPRYRVDPTPVLDLTSRVGTAGEGGLLGLAFSPDGGLLYVSYTDRQGNSVISEHSMNGDRADGAGRIVLQVEQPFSNHNGGQITFGPDGHLYVGFGDGGSGGDPLDSGQDTSTLLGSILRIDPASPTADRGYGIPAGNPFGPGEAARPETWLWGVRNPWRFSFDRATGDLWIGDVGQNAIEEVTFLPAAGGTAGRAANLGWRLMEGDTIFDGAGPPPDHTGPIYTYDHGNGRCSVTGGYVYRGSRLANLDGVYLFGDYCSNEIFGLQRLDDGSILVADVVTDRTVANLVSFGQDAAGEIYVLGSDGSIRVLQPPG